MNAERLLAQFERISDAPDAIPRLRRFILDLAVRGKLVEQDPEEEPAEELLSCITKRKKASLLTARDESPFPFDLPTGWVHTTLRTLVESSGSGWSPKTLDTPREGNEWGILKVSAVSWDQFRPEANKQVLPGTQPRPQAIIRKGDFLISRANTAELVARAVIVESEPINLMMSDKIVRLELVEPCEPKYILINNNHSTFARSYYAGRATGVSPSMKNVARGVILDLPLPLPPLAEQHRIVAKVDELMALCDQLEAARQKREQGRERLLAATLQRLNQPAEDPASFRQDASFALQVLPSLTTTSAQIKQLRQTILNLAVRGKLVEQDPEDEPAVDLLATISFERVDSVKSRKMKSPRPVAPYDGDGEYELPRGWAWSQLGSITAVEDGAMCDGPFGSKLKTEHYIGEPGFAVVRLGNIGIGEFLWGKEGHITREHFESLPGNHISPGDLLVAGLADPLVRCCEAPANLGPAVNKADCFRLRLHRLINRFFVCQFLNSPVAKSFAAEENHGMTRERINLANAKSIPIPLPPLAEQHRIVAKVDELMALCDQLEQQLSQADQQRRRLLEAVLAEALGGRLPTGQEESHAAIA
jgi:type I restriction enzyme S subunit